MGAAATAGATGAYKAPGLRAGAEGAPRVMSDAEKVNLKVSNLSPETIEDDLRALFQPFGNLAPFRLIRDQATNISKGFAYLRYSTHREAQAAQVNLNGFRLHHMVIKVEFVERREDRPGGGGMGGHKYLSGYGKSLADTSGANVLSHKQ